MTRIFALIAFALIGTVAFAAPVLMISVDGLRPSDALSNDASLKIPNIRALIKNGAYATGTLAVLPSVTYPSHTTLVTGVSPAEHGIANNKPFDPLEKNAGGLYWYASDIKVETLWDLVHKSGKKTASFYWPVTLGAESIDFNIPEFWRQRATTDESKLIRAVSTLGMISKLEKATGVLAAKLAQDIPSRDAALCVYAAELIAKEKPYFTTIHLVNFDHVQHEHGPGTKQALAALEEIDAMLGPLIDTVRKVQPEMVIALVSDHGFTTVKNVVNLMVPFVEAGLVKIDAKSQKVAEWQAMPWSGGGSAAIVLANPQDEKVKEKVRELLLKLSANPDNGIVKFISQPQIKEFGGPQEASFVIDFADGFYASTEKKSGALVSARTPIGGHGYFPDHKQMLATFIVSGPTIKKNGSIGEIDMRDIAPTIAGILGMKLSSAVGKNLFP